VALLFEEAEEGFTDFCAFHRFLPEDSGRTAAKRHGGGGTRSRFATIQTDSRQRAALYRAHAARIGDK
ncbi:MAG TPA: hypothetical protein DHV63_17245, partial [Pseudomonas sp.]|nr:hypothetical protein [Pseudomonas sp.]